MNRIFLISLLSAPMLHGMEAPRPTVVEINKEKKFGPADKELHDFAKLSLMSYRRPYRHELEARMPIDELRAKRDHEAHANALQKILALKEAGANINSLDPLTQKTALHLASEANNHITLEVLLHQGADPNIRDKLGKTPLMKITGEDADDPRLRILILYGARIDGLQSMENVRICFESLWQDALEHRYLNTIKKYIDQGAWSFYTWRNTLFKSLKRAEGKRDDNRAILELLLTHPLPGPIWENEKTVQIVAQHARSWFTFFCAVKRTMPSLNLARDVRLKIRNMIFPSLNDIIKHVQTKNLARCTWIFGKTKLVNMLVAQHLKCARPLRATSMQEILDLSKIPENMKSFFDPEERERVIRPLLEKSYEQIVTPQESIK